MIRTYRSTGCLDPGDLLHNDDINYTIFLFIFVLISTFDLTSILILYVFHNYLSLYANIVPLERNGKSPLMAVFTFLSWQDWVHPSFFRLDWKKKARIQKLQQFTELQNKYIWMKTIPKWGSCVFRQGFWFSFRDYWSITQFNKVPYFMQQHSKAMVSLMSELSCVS